LFCVAVGACDTATGACLLAVPGLLLGVLDIAAPTSATVYIRLVGVFVACVGLAYLYPWLFPPGREREARLAVSVELTALCRFAVALFVGVSVVAGVLSAAWLTVAAFDGGVAIVQMTLLVRGVFGHAG
jgi:hypothetical protein